MISRVIKRLVASDFLLNFAFGLLAPIFAVFILENIEGSSLKAIGLASTFYWVARVVTTTPISRFMDRTDGERDEYFFMVFGSIAMSTLILFFIWADQVWHVYLIQLLLGLANSMAVPGWRILFTDHLDRGRVGIEWSFEDIAIGTSVAISAYLGAVIADAFGFKTVFILLAAMGYAGVGVLIPMWKNIKKEPKGMDRLGIPIKPEFQEPIK